MPHRGVSPRCPVPLKSPVRSVFISLEVFESGTTSSFLLPWFHHLLVSSKDPRRDENRTAGSFVWRERLQPEPDEHGPIYCRVVETALRKAAAFSNIILGFIRL